MCPNLQNVSLHLFRFKMIVLDTEVDCSSIRIISNSITIIVGLVSGRGEFNSTFHFCISVIYIFFVVLKLRQMTDRQNCVL